MTNWYLIASGGGLDKIVVLMEGESLFNDATSIVLFEIFFDMVKKLGDGAPGTEGGLLQEGLNIVVQICWLAAGVCLSLLHVHVASAYGWDTSTGYAHFWACARCVCRPNHMDPVLQSPA